MVSTAEVQNPFGPSAAARPTRRLLMFAEVLWMYGDPAIRDAEDLIEWASHYTTKDDE